MGERRAGRVNYFLALHYPGGTDENDPKDTRSRILCRGFGNKFSLRQGNSRTFKEISRLFVTIPGIGMFTLLLFFSADEFSSDQFLGSRSAGVGAAAAPHDSREAQNIHVFVECRLKEFEALEPEISNFKVFLRTNDPSATSSKSLFS